MSRGSHGRRPRAAARWLRCLAVWMSSTAALGSGLWLSLDTAHGCLSAPTAGFETVLVAGSSTVAAACLAWLWLLVTLAVVEATRGVTSAARPGLVRRAVLVACGGALVLGPTVPALAAPLGVGSEPAHSPVAGASVLSGLPLPDRPTAGRPQDGGADRPQRSTWVVHDGDTLWSIAARTLPVGAVTAQVDRRWREIHRLNSTTIGADPDLIVPGQSLALPQPPGSHAYGEDPS